MHTLEPIIILQDQQICQRRLLAIAARSDKGYCMCT